MATDYRRLLLISASNLHGTGYLEHASPEIAKFLGTEIKKVTFIPYALADHDDYASAAREKFTKLGYELVSVHEAGDPSQAIADAQAIFVGGGNTFRLLKTLYDLNLIMALRRQVLQHGCPYIGTSAGTNIATCDIRTTNDMPIVQPPTFDALNLVPFNINPHYLDADPNSTHQGETREERLKQFFEENDNTIVALREGSFLRVQGDTMTYTSVLESDNPKSKVRVFAAPNGDAKEYDSGSDLSFLLCGEEDISASFSSNPGK
eukprot:TRINITY_DN113738_c0_g1_i1.p1 TRINITY_DN113738_c0_g1~~TRINITY_DN113738_c0_g1_i1.p1  ORF type:complete len:271 (+),score=13.57 TRINITY_DN113738_c0_g1_i1:26-814(+)